MLCEHVCCCCCVVVVVCMWCYVLCVVCYVLFMCVVCVGIVVLLVVCLFDVCCCVVCVAVVCVVCVFVECVSPRGSTNQFVMSLLCVETTPGISYLTTHNNIYQITTCCIVFMILSLCYTMFTLFN